jgi:hypothetical protein
LQYGVAPPHAWPQLPQFRKSNSKTAQTLEEQQMPPSMAQALM